MSGEKYVYIHTHIHMLYVCVYIPCLIRKYATYVHTCTQYHLLRYSYIYIHPFPYMHVPRGRPLKDSSRFKNVGVSPQPAGVLTCRETAAAMCLGYVRGIERNLK